jgi:uncharacterized membrane protein YfcA
MWLAALAAFAGAAVQSASGLGFALVLTPALFAAMDDPAEAVTAVLLLGVALCALILFESRRVATHGLARLLVPAIPGLGVGVMVLTALSKESLQVGVGVAVVAAATWQLRHGSVVRIPAVVAGFLSGALTTSISVNGPPLALWLESERVSPARFRTTLAAAFLILDVAGVALIVAKEGGGAVDLGAVGPLLGCVAAGYALGAIGFRRLDAERFSTVVLSVVVCTGLASIVAGLV